jgi:hypothetical protein
MAGLDWSDMLERKVVQPSLPLLQYHVCPTRAHAAAAAVLACTAIWCTRSCAQVGGELPLGMRGDHGNLLNML